MGDTQGAEAQPEVAEGRAVTIRFDDTRCIHARFCTLTQPQVYKANVEGPWIDPDADRAEAIAAVAQTCPSGAITYQRHDGGPQEAAPRVNLIRIRENGPLAVHAEIILDGQPIGYRATLCRCGASRNKPFCDGAHSAAGFVATGEPATIAAEPLAVRDGALQITAYRNGPLGFSGNLEICSGTGRTVKRTEADALCRCGQSNSKPFCDGTHTKVGFVSD